MSAVGTDLLSSAAYTLLQRELGAKECAALPGSTPFEKLAALSQTLTTIVPPNVADLRYGFYCDEHFIARIRIIKLAREALYLKTDISDLDLSVAENRMVAETRFAKANQNRLSLARNEGSADINSFEINAKAIFLTRVPESLSQFSHVVTLDLSGNLIEALPPKLFESMQKIVHLFLQDNKILHLSADTFTPLTELQILDLSSNHLDSLQPGLFANLTKLETLKLYGNVLPEESFSNLPAIKYLEK